MTAALRLLARAMLILLALAAGSGGLAGQPRLPDPGARIDDAVVVAVLTPEGVVEDPVFGVAAPALGLERRVEMLQWQESIEPDGAARYQAVWSEQAIDSAVFAEADDHRNPGLLPFTSERWFAPTARLGGRPVAPDSLWRELGGWQPLSPDPTALPPNLALLFVPDEVGLITSDDPSQPQIGDLRVRWSALPGGPVSAPVVSVGAGFRPADADLAMVRVPSAPAEIAEPAGGRSRWADILVWLVAAATAAVLLVMTALIIRRSRQP